MSPLVHVLGLCYIAGGSGSVWNHVRREIDFSSWLHLVKHLATLCVFCFVCLFSMCSASHDWASFELLGNQC